MERVKLPQAGRRRAGQLLPTPQPGPPKKRGGTNMEVNMTRAQRQRVAGLARRLEWRKVKSEAYRSAPHEYASLSDRRRTWQALALMIKKHGEPRKWRG